MIWAAATGPVVKGTAGRDRAALYVIAVETGFRANELRSLTPESFDLAADPPTITVEAGYSKRRRADVQPIRRDLADALAPWLAAREPGRPVFPVPAKPAAMLRADLARARDAWLDEAPTPAEHQRRVESGFLAYKNAAGRVADFHALRHTFISRVVASGANVRVRQELARHSTPELAIGRYAHADMADKADALAALRPVTTVAHGTAPALLGMPSPDSDRRQDDLDRDGAEGVVCSEPVGTCHPLAANGTRRARSSVGQSIGFLNRGSQVRVLPGVFGPVAQRIEWRPSKPTVGGSNPSWPATAKSRGAVTLRS